MRYGVPDWDATVAALKHAPKLVIATHVNPDGDAIGSALGASLALRRLGKTTYPTWGSKPVAVPFNYTFLPGAKSFMQPEKVPDVDTLLAVDCGAAERLGSLRRLVESVRCVINVDHHAGNDEFGHLNVVVTGASSTAELITHLVRDVGIEIDRDIATCLYTGIVTDTGRFQYSNSSPEVLRLAADLLALGVPATKVAQEVFESSPFNYLKLTGRVLDRAVLLEDESFVYSWLTRADLKETGVSLDETERLIDLIRSTRSAEVAAMLKEQAAGSYRVSLRSKGPTSVGKIAREQGGGGHELAAGFTAPSIAEAIERILEALRNHRGR